MAVVASAGGRAGVAAPVAYEEAAAASSAVADRVEAAGEAPKVVVVQVWEVLEAVGWEVAA